MFSRQKRKSDINNDEYTINLYSNIFIHRLIHSHDDHLIFRYTSTMLTCLLIIHTYVYTFIIMPILCATCYKRPPVLSDLLLGLRGGRPRQVLLYA